MMLIGVGFVSVPFIKSFGIPEFIIEQNKPPPIVTKSISIKELKKGEFIRMTWHGNPIGVYRRTSEEVSQFSRMSLFVYDPFSSNQIASPFWLKYLDSNKQLFVTNKRWLKTAHRSINKEYFVFSLISPVLGCAMKLTTNQSMGKLVFPSTKPKGFYDPCSNASFDLAGRIFINNKFKHHMYIPNHRYIDENTIEFYPNDEN
jgi:ubiquinol-cytochrome c reductase iron-sulfur subunit